MSDSTFNLSTWHAVAENLPGKWHVGFAPGRDDAAHLLREDGLQLLVFKNWNTPNDKVSVTLSMNGGIREHQRNSETTPSINVSPTRTPKAIAGDITRRLLPDAEVFRQIILGRVAAADARQQALDAVRGQLLATGAVEDGTDTDKVHFKWGVVHYGQLRYGTDYVAFENVSVPLDTALKMLALLAEEGQK